MRGCGLLVLSVALGTIGGALVGLWVLYSLGGQLQPLP